MAYSLEHLLVVEREREVRRAAAARRRLAEHDRPGRRLLRARRKSR